MQNEGTWENCLILSILFKLKLINDEKFQRCSFSFPLDSDSQKKIKQKEEDDESASEYE